MVAVGVASLRGTVHSLSSPSTIGVAAEPADAVVDTIVCSVEVGRVRDEDCKIRKHTQSYTCIRHTCNKYDVTMM